MAKRPKKMPLTAVPLVSAMVVTMGCGAEPARPPMPPPMVAPMPPPMHEPPMTPPTPVQDTRDGGTPVAVPPMAPPPPMPAPQRNPPG